MARPGLDKHPKFLMFRRMLGEPRPHVRGYLDCLWETAYESGNPVIGTPEMVEAVCEFPGEPGKLFRALLECAGPGQAGFIEPVPGRDGWFRVHDLYDHAPDYVKKRAARESERRSTADTCEKPAEGGGQRRTKYAKVRQRRTTAHNGKTPTPTPTPITEEDKSSSVAKRDPDPLFDAIAEVTGSDPRASGSHIGRVKRALLAAVPPYTADDVRRLPDVLARHNLRVPVTLGVVEKYVGWLRSPPAGTTGPPGMATAEDVEDAALRQYRAEIQGRG